MRPATKTPALAMSVVVARSPKLRALFRDESPSASHASPSHDLRESSLSFVATTANASPALAPTAPSVMTTAGPEPLDNIQHPLDREHYVAKQVRPVAEPVLATLGLDFDVVIGDGRQVEMPF